MQAPGWKQTCGTRLLKGLRTAPNSGQNHWSGLCSINRGILCTSGKKDSFEGSSGLMGNWVTTNGSLPATFLMKSLLCTMHSVVFWKETSYEILELKANKSVSYTLINDIYPITTPMKRILLLSTLMVLTTMIFAGSGEPAGSSAAFHDCSDAIQTAIDFSQDHRMPAGRCKGERRRVGFQPQLACGAPGFIGNKFIGIYLEELRSSFFRPVIPQGNGAVEYQFLRCCVGIHIEIAQPLELELVQGICIFQ